MLRNIQRGHNMLIAEALILATRQQPRNLEDTLDLAAIDIHARQLGQLQGRNVMLLRCRIQEVLPDGFARLDAELLIVEADVDARLEGRVESLHAVGGQEHGALVVFEDAQEDGDELVALEFVQAALFEEDVGFVEQEDGVPAAAHFENVLQFGLDFSRVEAQVAGRHHIQRDLHFLSHALCCEGFADAGWAAKEDDHAAAFALDHVVEGVAVFALRLCEAED